MAPYVQTSESQLVALCQLPLPFVCKSQHLEVHGRLVNKLSRTHSGRLTSGKTLRLKYCLSSSSMSAQGLQDNICSLHVLKTWKPACRSFTPNQSHKRDIPPLPSSSQHLFPFPFFNEVDGHGSQKHLLLLKVRQHAPTYPHICVTEMTKSLIGIA